MSIINLPATSAGNPIDKGEVALEDGRMEARLAALETRIDTILPTLATKMDIAELRSDMHKASTDTSRWITATVIGLFLGFAGLFFAMNNTTKTPATAQPQPIIIYAQQPAAAPASAPTATLPRASQTK